MIPSLAASRHHRPGSLSRAVRSFMIYSWWTERSMVRSRQEWGYLKTKYDTWASPMPLRQGARMGPAVLLIFGDIKKREAPIWIGVQKLLSVQQDKTMILIISCSINQVLIYVRVILDIIKRIKYNSSLKNYPVYARYSNQVWPGLSGGDELLNGPERKYMDVPLLKQAENKLEKTILANHKLCSGIKNVSQY